MLGVYRIQIGPYFYIGSSNNCAKRKKEHKRHLESGDHYNPKMLAVYRKYGDFNFKVIEQTDTELQCRQREKSYIDLHFNDKHCLNISTEALCPPKTVKKTYWDGKVYPSRQSAHKASGLSMHIVNFRELYAQGFRTTEQVTQHMQQKQISAGRLITWNEGLESHKSIWQRLSIDPYKLKQCMDFGAKCDDDVRKFVENGIHFGGNHCHNPSCVINIFFNGAWYSGPNKAAENSIFSAHTIKKYYNLGFKSDAEIKKNKSAFTKPHKKPKAYKTKHACVYLEADGNRIEFSSLMSACRFLKIGSVRVRDGWKTNKIQPVYDIGIIFLQNDQPTTEEIRQYFTRLHSKR